MCFVRVKLQQCASRKKLARSKLSKKMMRLLVVVNILMIIINIKFALRLLVRRNWEAKKV